MVFAPFLGYHDTGFLSTMSHDSTGRMVAGCHEQPATILLGAAPPDPQMLGAPLLAFSEPPFHGSRFGASPCSSQLVRGHALVSCFPFRYNQAMEVFMKKVPTPNRIKQYHKRRTVRLSSRDEEQSKSSFKPSVRVCPLRSSCAVGRWERKSCRTRNS